MSLSESVEDQIDPSVLIGLEGMTAEQFANQTAAIGRDGLGFEMLGEDDEVPGVMVMRGDYDNVYRALASENPELAALTNASRSIADGMQFMANAVRAHCRRNDLEIGSFTLEQRLATETTLVFKIDAA